MIVCAHGKVSEYCKNHGMVICGEYVGDIEDYHGKFPVVVTDMDIPQVEFFALKERLLRRGVELISTRHSDLSVAEYIAHRIVEQPRLNKGGRAPFGYRWVGNELVESPHEMAVVKRILELREIGVSYSRIATDDRVRYQDGREVSVSTIQGIIKKYGK